MTERETMTCEHCRQLLADLVCGELNARDEAKARAHVEGCAACAKALAAFQKAIWAAAEVPLDEPSPALDTRIMAAAADQLSTQRSVRTLSPGRIAFGAWLARVGEWAMSPQVAMASVLVLVVGIGLYALPLARPNERAALAPASEPAAPASPAESPLGTGAALPTPSKSEEAREKKSATARAGRVSPGTRAMSTDTRARDRFAQPPPAGSGEGGPARRSASGSGGARDADDSAFGGVGAAAAAKPRAAAEPAPRAELAAPAASAPALPADTDKAEAEKSAEMPGKRGLANEAAASPSELRAQESAPAMDAPAPVAPSTAAPVGAAPVGAASSGAASESAAPPPPPAQPAAPKPPSERAELARGMQALTAGRLPQAINVLTPLARGGSDEVRDLAQALLAEALHDANRCSEAVPWFARVVARPTASARSLELAADCYAKTGRDAKATELRNRARSR